MAKGSGSLAGRRILVVEDDWFIAQDICELLTGCGAEILGPHGQLEPGVDAAETADPLDGAVIDLNLHGAETTAILERLAARNVRFVIVTGYDTGGLAAEFTAAPRLVKPFDGPMLRAAVEKEIGGRHG